MISVRWLLKEWVEVGEGYVYISNLWIHTGQYTVQSSRGISSNRTGGCRYYLSKVHQPNRSSLNPKKTQQWQDKTRQDKGGKSQFTYSRCERIAARPPFIVPSIQRKQILHTSLLHIYLRDGSSFSKYRLMVGMVCISGLIGPTPTPTPTPMPCQSMSLDASKHPPGRVDETSIIRRPRAPSKGETQNQNQNQKLIFGIYFGSEWVSGWVGATVL